MQDPDLGWIRNVMRVAGTECDVAPNRDPGRRGHSPSANGSATTNSGQLGYYRRKVEERLARHKITQSVVRLGLLATAIALAALLLVGQWLPHEVSTTGRLPDGLRPADGRRAAVLCEEHGRKRAHQAVRVHAADLPQRAAQVRRGRNDTDRRRILKILGDAALEEHAEWILMHRERAIDQNEAARLG